MALKDTAKSLARKNPVLHRAIERANFTRKVIWSPQNRVRTEIARRYLHGEGIEIGALHYPLTIPRGARVHYVDRMKTPLLREQYPELWAHKLVDISIVENGEKIHSVPLGSLDFVVANHLIEHCQDPIATIENWLQLLKPEGILYIAVPDKRHTFDIKRSTTPLEHLLRDYEEGSEWSRLAHFEEWARCVEDKEGTELSTRIQELLEMDYSIHFHVWEPTDFLTMLIHCRSLLHFPMDIESMQCNGQEFILILRKTRLAN